MNVDISPKRPPINSCTAAAPSGSGSDGGGSSVAMRSMRLINGFPSPRAYRSSASSPTTGARNVYAVRPLRRGAAARVKTGRPERDGDTGGENRADEKQGEAFVHRRPADGL